MAGGTSLPGMRCHHVVSAMLGSWQPGLRAASRPRPCWSEAVGEGCIPRVGQPCQRASLSMFAHASTQSGRTQAVQARRNCVYSIRKDLGLFWACTLPPPATDQQSVRCRCRLR
eukprot:scaffold1374_cov115-Isochrysis_galbana.AAC.6